MWNVLNSLYGRQSTDLSGVAKAALGKCKFVNNNHTARPPT